jgi:hypothetical protein
MYIYISCGLSQSSEEKKGIVSFISSQNIYTKFNDTKNISEGDTLYYRDGNKLIPAVAAKYISSTSVAGEIIGNLKITINDELIVFIKNNGSVPQPVESEENNKETIPLQNTLAGNSGKKLTGKEKINGRFSVQSYSNISNSVKGDFQRWRYTVSFNGKNLYDSPLSVKTHMNFNYKADEWNIISRKPANNIRVYDLAVKYDLTNRSSFIIGRHLNEKITNISSIDGVQYQGPIGDFNTGVFAGSRPDFSNMGFNLKLFQAGVYVNRSDSIGNNYTDNTLALVQQTNDFKTDRRLLYFQHSNNFINSLSMFFSAEADLYKKINNESKNELSLTGLFISARYNPLKEASFSFSYDARRNIKLYETFKNYLETLLENEMRQGLRAGVHIRPFSKFSIGANLGYRFRKGDPAPSNDLGGYLSYSLIPVIEITPTISYTRIKSSYLSGNVISAMISKNIEFANSSFSVIYRNSDYMFSGNLNSNQHSVSADLSSRIIKEIFFSLGWEGIFDGNRTNGRILVDLTSRL